MRGPGTYNSIVIRPGTTFARRRLTMRGRFPSGFTLVELMISGLLLGVVFVAAIPTMAWIARERTAAERRQIALLEVGNQMERLCLIPWDELPAGAAPESKLAASAIAQLPEAQLTVVVDGDPRDPSAKRITVELRWMNGPSLPAAPVRVTTWVYRRGREAT